MSEKDDAPAHWMRWARWRAGEGWTMHERPLEPIGRARTEDEPAQRRPRGNQDYSGLHVGRGTRWTKPRTS